MNKNIRTGFLTLAAAAVLLTSPGCSDEMLPVLMEQVEPGKLIRQLSTDKAAYQPGEAVNFELSFKGHQDNGELLVRYKHLDETVKEEVLDFQGDKVAWSWNPPTADFQGYMVELFVRNAEGKEADHANIAVDVSSDWGTFPRYGYLAEFGKMNKDDMAKVIDRLNRFHINGIQFYDWQYKHHQPVKWEGDGRPVQEWPDIANRPVSYATVKTYIDLAHGRNMKAMNYNLLFGANKNSEEDGTKKEWALYKDPRHDAMDYHPLPDSWASHIYMYDPSNPGWQDYLIGAEKKTFEALPFDGWHVDQLGDRGQLWNFEGKSVDLAATYPVFLKKAKEKLGVDLVMNAVGQYGQSLIGSQAPVKFLYTEVWENYPNFSSLRDIVNQNLNYSQNRYNTVFAAYMNYKLSDAPGSFNTPGILLADAVMFASGGSHLELGENMLSKEYFPHKNLKIPESLEKQLVHYYDFLVAYQNLLREGLEESDLKVVSADSLAVSDQADKGKVWTFSKRKGKSDVVHLINFTDATTVSWNDTLGKQAEPALKENVTVSIKPGGKVSKVWFASPDFFNGSAVEVGFMEKDGLIDITLPKLKYWDMLVIEYKD